MPSLEQALEELRDRVQALEEAVEELEYRLGSQEVHEYDEDLFAENGDMWYNGE